MKKLTLVLALLLSPTLAFAALLEGTVEKVDKGKKQIVLKTEKGQETVEFDNATKGVEKAKAGAKVTVTFNPKGEKLMASEIVAAEASSQQGPQRDKPAAPDGMKEKIPPAVK